MNDRGRPKNDTVQMMQGVKITCSSRVCACQSRFCFTHVPCVYWICDHGSVPVTNIGVLNRLKSCKAWPGV